MSRMRTFQAQLTLPASIARVQAAAHAIERIGGRVEIRSAGTAGVTIVRLHLPEPHAPERFVPGLPFYPA